MWESFSLERSLAVGFLGHPRRPHPLPTSYMSPECKHQICQVKGDVVKSWVGTGPQSCLTPAWGPLTSGVSDGAPQCQAVAEIEDGHWGSQTACPTERAPLRGTL